MGESIPLKFVIVLHGNSERRCDSCTSCSTKRQHVEIVNSRGDRSKGVMCIDCIENFQRFAARFNHTMTAHPGVVKAIEGV